jgi:hypothetical protein
MGHARWKSWACLGSLLFQGTALAGIAWEVPQGRADFAWLGNIQGPRGAALGAAGVAQAPEHRDPLSQTLALADTLPMSLGWQKTWLATQIGGDIQALWWTHRIPQGQNIWSWQVIGAHLGYDALQGRDEESRPLANYEADQGLMALQIAMRHGQGVGSWEIGVRPSWILGRIESYSSNAFAVDLASRYQFAWGLAGGIRVRHLGWGEPYISREIILPLEAQAGVEWQKHWNPKWLTGMYMDVRHRNAEGMDFPAGVQLQWMDLLRLRLGQEWNREGAQPAGGLGLHLGIFDLDYAFIGRQTVGGEHRVGILLGI